MYLSTIHPSIFFKKFLIFFFEICTVPKTYIQILRLALWHGLNQDLLTKGFESNPALSPGRTYRNKKINKSLHIVI